MPNDTRNDPEIENFIKDFMANQKHWTTPQPLKNDKKINNRFETYIKGQYDVSVQRQGRQAIDAMREPKAEGGFPDLNKDGKTSYADVLIGRGVDLDREGKAEGSMLVPPEMEMTEEPPVDTYDNISPEEKVQQAEDMLPDDEMEDEFVDYVAEEVLEPEEQRIFI